jgi:hypothetical protein
MTTRLSTGEFVSWIDVTPDNGPSLHQDERGPDGRALAGSTIGGQS